MKSISIEQVANGWVVRICSNCITIESFIFKTLADVGAAIAGINELLSNDLVTTQLTKALYPDNPMFKEYRDDRCCDSEKESLQKSFINQTLKSK